MSYSRYHSQLLPLKVCTIDKLFMGFSFLPLKTQFRDFILVSDGEILKCRGSYKPLNLSYKEEISYNLTSYIVEHIDGYMDWNNKF